jgi:hypothetical protein
MSGPSRLSSLLVRDGLIGVKRMEQAFQRQVIYGGALDTILLEMGAITEERLAEYLSLASGLPPADRNLLDYFDPRAVQVCPRELAEEFRVVPVAFDGEALRVLVSDPVDLASLEALATRIGAPIQPFVVPEFRFSLLVERLFGVPAPSRYMSLAARQAASKRPAPPEPKVIVEDVHIRRMAETRTRTGPMSTDTVARALERQEEKRKAASASFSPVPAAANVPSHIVDDLARSVRATPRPNSVPAPPVEVKEPDTPRLRAEPAPTPDNVPHVVRAPEGTQMVRVSWHGDSLLDPSPLEPRVALEQLRAAGDRDGVFHTLIRGVRARTTYAATLVVQGDTAFGREAISTEGSDGAITQIALPLAGGTPFRSAIVAQAPYIGPIASGQPSLDITVARMGGVLPSAALLMPVVIKNRVVALVYAHRGGDPLTFADVAEVLPLAPEAAIALTKLILRSKSSGYGRAPDPTPPPLAVEDLAPKTAPDRTDSGKWKRVAIPPDAPAPTLALGADAPAFVGVGEAPIPTLRRPIEQIIGTIEGGGSGAAEAYDEAVRRVDETLGVLRRRLPGKLWVDRYSSARPTRASQHGPLLALLVRLGERAVPLLLELLSNEDRELRYYATLACSEVRNLALVPGLTARLFDQDYGVRGAAVDALHGYPPRDTEAALGQVRNALHGDAARARAAAHALGELRDIGAIPELISTLERDHTTGEEARRALVQLTKQDFQLKAKKWRSWWEKNRERPRLEWMLEGLGHSEEEVRLSASEELKRVTGEYFGYHYDLPKREREEARARWLKWWEEVGKRRFLRLGVNEAERPTAMLPQHNPRR